MRTILLILLIFFFVCPQAEAFRMRKVSTTTPPEPPDAYTVVIEGVENRKLLDAMREASVLINESKRAPTSFTALQYRAESDAERMVDLLNSYGYYGARVSVRYERDVTPPRIILLVTTGPLYPLVGFQVVPPELEEDPWEGRRYPLDQIQPAQLCLRLDAPANAEQILEAQGRLLRILERCGYPLARVVDQEAVVDMAKQIVDVTMTVDSGPLCTFGPLDITGLRRVRRRFVTQCLGWRRGQVFSPKRVEKTIGYLRRSGLFRGIRVIHAPEALPDGQLPITIELEESKPRTIAIGVSYNIDQGFGPEFEWEDRNLFGMGEDLNIRLTTGNRKQELGIHFRRPHFRHCDQDLLLGVDLTHQNKPGYLSSSAKGFALIDRILNRHWGYSYGVAFEQLGVKRTNNNGDFSLLSFPLNLRYINVDSILDPSRGFKVNLEVTPTVNFVDNEELIGAPSTRFYSKQQITGAIYQALTRNKKIILAAWSTLGTIHGSTLTEIPGPERFYAGSDQTLRGYSYQTVGPLRANGKPLGGRSLFVVGVEPRFRLTETWGFAVFYEAGNVYTTQFPDFHKKLFQSVGFGPRYYTPVGPISLDIAFPLQRRSIDRKFQVYVNIGQTF